MEVRQLIYFIEVAKREHVTKAAEALHIAQSAISRQISMLEAELKVTLFIREGRNVKLTTMGRVLLEHAERVLFEIDKAKEKVAEYLNPEMGSIRIGFSTGLSVHTFSRVFAQFQKKYPNLACQFLQGNTTYLLDLLEKGEIDLAFAAPLPIENNIVKTDIFFTEKMFVLLNENHPLVQEEQVSFHQLSNEKFITFHQGTAIREMLMQTCNKAGFSPVIVFEGEDVDTMKGLVSQGLGIAVLPELTLSYNLPNGVKAKPIRDADITRPVGLMTLKKRELAPSEKLLYNFLLSFYEKFYKFQL